MLETKKELREFLEYEKKLYSGRMGGGTRQNILRIVKSCEEEYAVLAGAPARSVKYNK